MAMQLGHTVMQLVSTGDDKEIKRLFKENKLTRDVVNYIHDDHSFLAIPPLHIATIKEEHKIMEILIEAGADLEAQDIRKNTAVDRCFDNSIHSRWGPQFGTLLERSRTESLRILLTAGADPNGGRNAVDKPLFRAVDAGWKECVELLLSHGAETVAVSALAFDGYFNHRITEGTKGTYSKIFALLEERLCSSPKTKSANKR